MLDSPLAEARGTPHPGRRQPCTDVRSHLACTCKSDDWSAGIRLCPAAPQPASRQEAGGGRALGHGVGPARGVDDAADGVRDAAGHQQRRAGGAQRGLHRARIRQHRPAQRDVDARLRAARACSAEQGARKQTCRVKRLVHAACQVQRLLSKLQDETASSRIFHKGYVYRHCAASAPPHAAARKRAALPHRESLHARHAGRLTFSAFGACVQKNVCRAQASISRSPGRSVACGAPSEAPHTAARQRRHRTCHLHAIASLAPPASPSPRS